MAGELKNNRRELKKAIGKAKKEAWDELLEGLNRDPWGRPYKAIMNKIKSDSVDICRKLPGEVIEGILDSLFPRDRGLNIYKRNRNKVEE